MSRESEATARLAPCPHCGKHHDEDSLRCPATDMLLPLEGRRLDGKFRFLSALGSGGMATVYLAVNERVDREVAIKFLRPEVGRDAESVARFRSEAKAAGRIGNAHICEILDLGESPIGPYIVMERLRGIDLAALIRRQTRLAPGYAVRVVRHALEGLAAAHEAGIVHRDLKPGNVFLHRTDSGDTIVKLMDFGVSKFLDGSGEAETASGILLGTPEYMAPEQLEGAHKIGPPADIWAMGAILYRAITGHQVFSGPNLASVLRAMAIDEVRPLSQLVSGVPAELEVVIHKCLERSPGARYPTAKALSDALAPFEELDVEVVAIAQPEKVVDIPSSELQPLDHDESPVTQVWRDEPSPPPKPKPVAPVAPVAPVGPVAPVIGAPVVLERKRKPLWVVGALFVAAAVALAVALLFPRDDATEAGRDVPGPLADATDTGPANEPPDPADGDDGASQAATTVDAPVSESDTSEGDTGDGEPGESDDNVLEVLEALEALDETEGEPDETGGGTGHQGPRVIATDRPAPPGTTRSGPFITPRAPGPATDHTSAKRECQALAAKSFAGVSNWSLAAPTQLRQFASNPDVKRSRYWTSALHKGQALVFVLPGAKKSSEKADRKIARAFCVAKY